jgi:hypothetical protein
MPLPAQRFICDAGANPVVQLGIAAALAQLYPHRLAGAYQFECDQMLNVPDDVSGVRTELRFMLTWSSCAATLEHLHVREGERRAIGNHSGGELVTSSRLATSSLRSRELRARVRRERPDRRTSFRKNSTAAISYPRAVARRPE